MRQISEQIYFSEASASVYEFTASADENHNIGKVQKLNGMPDKSTVQEIKYWGDDNLLPQRREALIMKNHFVANLLTRRAEILAGQGLVQYKEVYEDGKKKVVPEAITPMLKQWLERIDCLDCVVLPAAIDYYMHGGFFLEIIRELEGEVRGQLGPIKIIRCVRAKYMRICKKKNGVITHYAYCADWESQSTKSDNTGDVAKVEIIPAFEPGEEGKKFKKSIVYIGDSTLHDGYYFHPAYWGAEGWIDVSNGIATYHKHDLLNSYDIRYQISYPEGYFMDMDAYVKAKDNDEELAKCYNAEDEAKKAFLKVFEKNMGGSKNAGKNIFTEKVYNKNTKQYDEITITVIENKPRGESLTKLNIVATEAIVTANNMPPILANVMQPGNSMSSGSEMLNSHQYYISTATYIPRKRILKTIIQAIDERKLRDTPDTMFSFEDAILTKLDENKSGKDTKIDGK